MLDAPKPFLFRSRNELTVTQDAGRTVAMKGV
jgi:hypothetical protein